MDNLSCRPEFPVFDATTFIRARTTKPAGGRPEIGGQISLAMGRVLGIAQQWGQARGASTAAALRELCLLGALTGERVLASADPLPPSTRHLPHLEQLHELIHAAWLERRTIRRSHQRPGRVNDVLEAYVVAYHDPETPEGDNRWAVVAEEEGGVWIWDYPTKVGAIVRYEHQVRALAEVDIHFDITDVEDVPTPVDDEH